MVEIPENLNNEEKLLLKKVECTCKKFENVFYNINNTLNDKLIIYNVIEKLKRELK